MVFLGGHKLPFVRQKSATFRFPGIFNPRAKNFYFFPALPGVKAMPWGRRKTPYGRYNRRGSAKRGDISTRKLFMRSKYGNSTNTFTALGNPNQSFPDSQNAQLVVSGMGNINNNGSGVAVKVVHFSLNGIFACDTDSSCSTLAMSQPTGRDNLFKFYNYALCTGSMIEFTGVCRQAGGTNFPITLTIFPYDESISGVYDATSTTNNPPQSQASATLQLVNKNTSTPTEIFIKKYQNVRELCGFNKSNMEGDESNWQSSGANPVRTLQWVVVGIVPNNTANIWSVDFTCKITYYCKFFARELLPKS